MANRQLTLKTLASHKKHGSVVLEQLNGLLEAKSITSEDIDLIPCLEQDFGPNYRDRITSMSEL